MTEPYEINRSHTCEAPDTGDVLLVRFESADGGQQEAFVRVHSAALLLLRGNKVDSRLTVILWRRATESEKLAFEELENSPQLPSR